MVVDCVEDAVDVVMDYFSRKGIIIFNTEIQSVKRHDDKWTIEIKGNVYTGIVTVNVNTGKIEVK